MMDPRWAEAIGHGFVNQYYNLIERAPKDLYKYYHHYSVVSRPNGHDIMETVTTIDAIYAMLMSWNNGCKLEMRSTDVQTGHMGGVLVLVTGCFVGKNNIQKKFAQSFFLAPQDYPGRYFVQNDVLRFVEETKSVEVNCDPVPGISNSAVKSVQNDSTTIVKKKIVKKKNAKKKIVKKITDCKDTFELVEKTPSKVDPESEGKNNATLVVDKSNQNASERSNTRKDRKDDSMLVENRNPKRVVDAEDGRKNNASIVVEETINAKKRSDVHLQDGSLLVNDPSVENNSTSGLKDKLMESQALDCSNIQTDLDDGSLLVQRPLEKDMDGVQNNASAVDTDLGDSSLLVENQPLEKNVVVESLRNAATLVVKKKKKTKKESLFVADCSNVDSELKEGSVLIKNPSDLQMGPLDSSQLVENPSLCKDTNIETEQLNAITEVKKKKRKKKNLVASAHSNVVIELKENTALVENPDPKQELCVKNMQTDLTLRVEENKREDPKASEHINIQTDVQNDPLLAEGPALERALDVEIEKCDAAKEVKKKRKRKKDNVVASEYSNVDTEVADALVADTVVETLQETVTSVGKKKKRRKKEIHIENVDTDLKIGYLLDDPHLNRDMDVENAQKDTIAYVEEKMKENFNASVCGNVGTGVQDDGSLLVENSPLKVDMESGQENAALEVLDESQDMTVDPHLNRDVHVENADTTVDVEEKVQESVNASECGNIGTGVQDDGSLLLENPALKIDMESVQESAELEVKKTKRKKAENLVKNVGIDLKAGSLLNESPHLDSDMHVEKEQANATLEVKKKTKRKKKKEQNPLEASSVRTDVEEGLLLVESISSLPRDLTVENKEELVCDKPKKKKDKTLSADENLQAPESSLPRESISTVHIIKDILVKEASVTCADGPSASKKRKSSKKNLKEVVIGDTTQVDVSGLTIPMDTVGDKIAVQDALCVEKGPGDLSGRDHQLKYLEPNNLLVGNMEENKHSLSSFPKIEDITALDIDNSRDLLQLSDSSPERSLLRPKKKLIILDVNGLLADIVLNPSHGYKPNLIISGKQVFKRPFCDGFLQFLLDKFDVGVWSSRVKKNVDRVISFLMGNSMNRLLFCWDQSHCTHTGVKTVDNNEKPLVLKELKKLWEKQEPGLPWEKGQYNESNTLLLDDSPYKALRNPAHTAIFPESYRHNDRLDKSLGPGGDLRVYLEGLARADNVQEYVKQNPFGQKPITETDLSWEFYSTIIDGDSKELSVPQTESSATNICLTVNG